MATLGGGPCNELAVNDNQGVSAATPEIRLLGRFLVVRGGEEVPVAAFGGRKVRQLIRVLAVRGGSHVSHDTLADALWPDRAPADPAANIGVLVNRARRALGDPSLITTTVGGYALTGPCDVDADLFAGDVAYARTVGESRAALRAYLSALDRWTGEPLAEDADAEWAMTYRDRLIRLHDDATVEAATVALDRQETTLAVSLGRAAVAAEPLRESAYLVLARALGAVGDHAAALATLDSLRRILADELGIDPSAEAATVRTALLGEPTRARPVAVAAPAGATPARSRVLLPFVGRSGQLAEILGTVCDAAAPVAAIVGPAGSGKSRLLAEVASRVDAPVATARAFLAENHESWSLARSLLREVLAVDGAFVQAFPRRAIHVLADLLPDLADAEAVGQDPGDTGHPLDQQTRRALIIEGGLRLLQAAADAGVLVIIDDLQWTDASSLTLLAAALERVPNLRVLLAYRPRALFATEAFQRHIRAIELPALSSDDLAQMTDAALADAVRTATDGSPFAVAEVIGRLIERGELIREPRGRWRPGSAKTFELAVEFGREGRRRSVRTRALAHSPAERDVLGLLVVAARQLPARTLAHAADRPEPQVLDALVSLSGSGLVQLGDRGWDTGHDLVRETIVDDLIAVERGRLHGRLAAALAAEGAEPAELARHHAAAGDAEAATAYYTAAARECLHRYADAETADLTAAGLALADRSRLRYELLDIRAQTRVRQGDLAGARADLRELLAATNSGPARAGLLSRQAMLHSGAEDLQRASALAEAAIVEAGGDPAASAQALETAAILDMNLGESDRSGQRSDRALALYTELGDARGVARIMDGRAMAVFLDGRIAAAIDLFDRVAALFTDFGDLLRTITPQSTLGHALVFHAKPDAGLGQAEAALDLARSLGNREGQTYALWHRAEALAALDRADDAIRSARAAVDIAEEIRHRGWTATSQRALGIALAARGRHDDALAAFDRSLQSAARLPLFASWAASRIALTLIAAGERDRAAGYVAQALVEGPPLAGYEARLAEVELAAANRSGELGDLATVALRLATEGGHVVSARRLAEVTG